MADRVLPNVRILLPCDSAVFDLADETWTLKNPWDAVQLPADARFPFRVREMWVYGQFADGLGTLDVSVELLRVRDDGSRRLIGTSAATQFRFLVGEQLLTRSTAFRLRNVPFRNAGLFEFRATVETERGSQVLSGPVAELRVIDGRGGL